MQLQQLLPTAATIRNFARHEGVDNSHPSFIGLVREGIFREFVCDSHGKEHNRAFCFPGDFAGDFPGDFPGSSSIQALTSGSMWVIPAEEFDRLVQTEPAWLQAAHEWAHDRLMKKFEREYQLLTLPAPERYNLLEARAPRLIREIPAYHLASYLGITPISLSRLRNTRRNTHPDIKK
jgi:CRP-like cAMP-binding protein